MDFNGIQAKEEILAKSAGGGFGVDVGVGGRENSHIDAPRRGRADALEIPGFQDAQEFRLQVERDVGDFVQKQRAAVREFEPPNAVGTRIGEGTLHMPEQFAFKYALGESPSVYCHHGLCRTRGQSVQRPCHHFFACAMFSSDQNVGVGRANLPDEFQDGSHRRRICQKRWPRFRAQHAVFRFEARRLPQCLAQLNLRSNDSEQALVFPGLGDEVSRSTAHRFDGQFDAAPGGHDHDGHGAVYDLNAREQVEPFLTGSSVSRVIEVHENGVEFAGFDGVDGLGRGSYALRLVALTLEEQAKRITDVLLVVCQKHSIRWRAGSLHSIVLIEFISMLCFGHRDGSPEYRRNRGPYS